MDLGRYSTALYVFVTIVLVASFADGFVLDANNISQNVTQSVAEATVTEVAEATVTSVANEEANLRDFSVMDIVTGRKRRKHQHFGGMKHGFKHGFKHGGFGGGKRKRMKAFFPIMIGVIIAKSIILPMILKAVTIMSSAAVVFSKMSLLATIMLGLKLFLTQAYNPPPPPPQAAPTSPKVEIVHVPIKKYQQNHEREWDRETSDENKFNFNQPLSDNYQPDYKPVHYI